MALPFSISTWFSPGFSQLFTNDLSASKNIDIQADNV